MIMLQSLSDVVTSLASEMLQWVALAEPGSPTEASPASLEPPQVGSRKAGLAPCQLGRRKRLGEVRPTSLWTSISFFLDELEQFWLQIQISLETLYTRIWFCLLSMIVCHGKSYTKNMSQFYESIQYTILFTVYDCPLLRLSASLNYSGCVICKYDYTINCNSFLPFYLSLCQLQDLNPKSKDYALCVLPLCHTSTA